MSFLINNQTFGQKLIDLNWVLVLLLLTIGGVGVLALYSAAGGNLSPWASKHIMRLGIGLVLLFVIAFIDVRTWFQLSWPLYGLGLLLLLYVHFFGHTGMGAQRWIDLKFMKLQPSEVMKIALIMVFARCFHTASAQDLKRITFYIVPALALLTPVALVFLQPDLGTSLMMTMLGAGMVFVAGLSIWVFIGAGIAAAAAIPLAWKFLIQDYQKQRVMTFINPESDPLGAGYHITQSKIALGSGGIEGKGFLKGTQSNLNFLPEKHTDFIFTLWAEEWGFSGGVFLLLLFAFLFIYIVWLTHHIKHGFGRLLALGVSINIFLYVFINIGMVMGLLPVVGAPLPLVSYGGTSLLATCIAFGLVISASLYKGDKVY